MLALFDNIAIRVEEDTGKICDECLNYLADSNYKFNSQLNHQPATTNQNNFMRHEFLADC
ncbi:hypothetical protein [Deefgea sp. CFH1-16]|uniref:hypothetical protein n=1 Tax=Deefgea sp. CFH1-16 TaxID=2675457 RepID=UPI0019403166|nr:hypothetical protein [Deefgea sp. CFH1-16]MBM5575590.1 hypothetical protein [Deefgea sp. CFH1-16]